MFKITSISMKKITLIITFLGIFALLILLNFSPPIQVSSQKEISRLIDNSKVQTQGRVIGERQIENAKILKLDNSIEVLCQSCSSQINRTLSIVGVVESYQNKTQIRALTIETS